MTLPPGAALIVVYHYVRPRSREEAGIRPLFVEEFEAQLDWLAGRFRMVSLVKVVTELASAEPPPGPAACALTFDDGMRDHIEVVAPILRSRGLPGAFFIFTRPWEEGVIAGAHKLHLLLSRLRAEELWQRLPETLRDRADLETARRVYHYEDEEARAGLKYALNFVASEEEASAFLDEHFRQALGEEREWVARTYLTPGEARELAEEGFEIGNHGYSHSLLTNAEAGSWGKELERSHAHLTRSVGRPPRFFAPSFGRIPAGAAAALRRLGYLGMLALPEGVNRAGQDAFALRRLDCIHLPPRLPAEDSLARLQSAT